VRKSKGSSKEPPERKEVSSAATFMDKVSPHAITTYTQLPMSGLLYTKLRAMLARALYQKRTTVKEGRSSKSQSGIAMIDTMS